MMVEMPLNKTNLYIIIKLCWPHRFLSLSLSSITLAGLPNNIQCPCNRGKFLLVGPHWHCPCIGVHRRMLLMSSSLLLQQCSICLVCLTSMVFEMGGKWMYSCCFVGYCFKTAQSRLVLLSFSFFFMCFVSFHWVYLYSSIATA